MQLPGPKRLFGITLIFFFLGLMGSEAYQILEDREETKSDQLESMDCGVVLTGGPGRIREAIEILSQNKIKKLIISGVYKEASLAEIFPPLPFYPDVQVGDILLEKHSESTFGNAAQSLALVQSLKCKDVLLITSQMHMHRAYKIFRKLYPSQIPIRKFYVNYLKKDHSEWDLLIESFKSVFYLVFSPVL